MTTATAAPAADDFDAAFSQFSVPEDGAKTEETPAAPAAAAEGSTPAAEGGKTDDTGATGDGTGGGEPAGTGAAPAGDGGGAAKEESVAPANAAPAGEGGAAPAAAGGDAGTAPQGGAAPAVEPPKADADAILDKLGKLVEAASTKPAEEKKPDDKTPESPYTPEQAAELEQYEKDWPDVAKFEGMRRQGEYKQLLDFVFSEVKKYVAPLQETLDALAGRTHLADVKSVVTDYSDQLRQQVVDWTKTQPAYLQQAYEHVINYGTVDEVKDLVDRYRQATGQAAPAAGAAVTTPTGSKQGGTNELSGAAKEAAAALAPVESKRSEVVASGDPDNFEDAWKQFSKDLG